MIVRLFRTGGLPPSENEKVVTVDDGRLAVWRSVGVPAVGSFVGQLSASESESIQALARRCVEAGDLTAPAVPDSAIDTLLLEGARVEVGQRARPEGAWGELLDVLRPLLERTDRPHAAIGLELAPDGERAWLRHLGSAALRVDLSSLRVATRLRTPTGEPGGSWATDAAGPAGQIEAGPGWEYELPFGHGFAAGDGTLTARAELVVYEREHPVAAELVASAGGRSPRLRAR
jgi:hypothetical protein